MCVLFNNLVCGILVYTIEGLVATDLDECGNEGDFGNIASVRSVQGHHQCTIAGLGWRYSGPTVRFKDSPSVLCRGRPL